MNKLQTYEQLIAGKIGELPVPDMADAIWANIEKGLDLNMPTQGPGQPPPATGTGWNTGIIVTIVVSVIIATFLLLKSKKQTAEPGAPPVTLPVPVIITDSYSVVPPKDSHSPVSRRPSENFLPGSRRDTAILNNRVNDPIETTDTANQQPIIEIPRTIVDSVEASPKQILPPKRGKGIKLTNPQYKIVPDRKDSV